MERHTHAIVIGRVQQVLLGDGRGALLYWQGAYDQLDLRQDEVARMTVTNCLPTDAHRPNRPCRLAANLGYGALLLIFDS